MGAVVSHPDLRRHNLLQDSPELLDDDTVTVQDLLEATWPYEEALREIARIVPENSFLGRRYEGILERNRA